MIYLIAYNDTLTSYSKEEVHKTITTVSGTSDWWHYLPNVYLLESTSNHNNIANAIIKKHPGLLFFIVRVDLSENNGVLNKDAWEWITSKSPKKGIRLKVSPSPSQSQSLSPLLSTILKTSSPSASSSLSAPTPTGLSDLLRKISEG